MAELPVYRHREAGPTPDAPPLLDMFCGFGAAVVEAPPRATRSRASAGPDTREGRDCGCGDPDYCLHLASGYPWCRPCEEHHRAPECAVNDKGESLASCGHPWTEVFESPGHRFGCPDLYPEYYPTT